MKELRITILAMYATMQLIRESELTQRKKKKLNREIKSKINCALKHGSNSIENEYYDLIREMAKNRINIFKIYLWAALAEAPSDARIVEKVLIEIVPALWPLCADKYDEEDTVVDLILDNFDLDLHAREKKQAQWMRLLLDPLVKA